MRWTRAHIYGRWFGGLTLLAEMVAMVSLAFTLAQLAQAAHPRCFAVVPEDASVTDLYRLIVLMFVSSFLNFCAQSVVLRFRNVGTFQASMEEIRPEDFDEAQANVFSLRVTKLLSPLIHFMGLVLILTGTLPLVAKGTAGGFVVVFLAMMGLWQIAGEGCLKCANEIRRFDSDTGLGL